MGVSDTYHSGRRYVLDHPGAVLVVVVGVLLLVDLVRQLATDAVSVTTLATFAWDGIVIGLAIGLAGVGLSMTYSILNFANFAHGDYLTSGAFVGWAVTYAIAGLGTLPLGDLVLLGITGDAVAGQVGVSIANTPFAVVAGLVVAVGFASLLTLAIDRVVFKPMRGQEGISLLIASVGVALALRYMIAFVWGTANTGITAGPGPVFPIPALGIQVSGHELALVVVSLALMAGVHLVLQRTKLGKAMRAMADNTDLALVTGIPTERVVRATWLIGGGLTGAAGYLIVLERGTMGFSFGWILLLLIFAAVILGGIGSVYGAMLGGLVIGVAERLALVWLPSDFTTAAAFGVMIVMLLVRPEGLFGGVTTA